VKQNKLKCLLPPLEQKALNFVGLYPINQIPGASCINQPLLERIMLPEAHAIKWLVHHVCWFWLHWTCHWFPVLSMPPAYQLLLYPPKAFVACQEKFLHFICLCPWLQIFMQIPDLIWQEYEAQHCCMNCSYQMTPWWCRTHGSRTRPVIRSGIWWIRPPIQAGQIQSSTSSVSS